MKRFVLCLAAGSLALLVIAPMASAFGWKDVLKMHRAGIADSIIVQKIEYSGKTFDLGADEMVALTEAGVSDSVISAMLRTEAEEYTDDYDRYDYPYYHPHSRIYVGWGHYYPRYRAYGYYPYYGGYYGGHRYTRRYYDGYRRHGYQGWSGDYGTTRERTRVESRIDPRTRSGAEYRTRSQTRPYTPSPRPGSSGARSRRR